MTYLRDKKRASLRRKTLIGVTLVIAGFFVLSTFGFSLSGLTQKVAKPFFSAGNVFGDMTANVLTVFTSKQSLVDENNKLKNTLGEISAKLIDRDELAKENAQLRTMFGQKASGNPSVVAKVLAGPGRTAYDMLLIDIGTTSGVAAGDKVLGPGSIAIGEVSDVYETTAKVVLYSSPGQKVNAVIGDTSIPTEAVGRGSGNFEASIPHDTSVSIGDVVRLPDVHLRFAGTIERIDETPNDPFKTLLFKSPINIFQIQWVEVLKNASAS